MGRDGGCWVGWAGRFVDVRYGATAYLTILDYYSLDKGCLYVATHCRGGESLCVYINSLF